MEPGPLGALERRILGVLIEKAFCTPDAYPMTVNAIMAGCNQKSARDPLLETNADALAPALERLKTGGLVQCIFPATGRTERWRHILKEAWDVDGRDRAALAELLLRGPQTEGELRANAKRMQEFPTAEDLIGTLESLAEDGFARRLSPAGQQRGVVWTHLLYTPEELARVVDRQRSAAEPTEEPALAADSTAPRRAAGDDRVAALEEQFRLLSAKLADLADAHDHLAGRVESLLR